MPIQSPLQIQPSQYPVHPDVKFKKLPFFDMLGELLKPSSLTPQGTMRLQESSFVFHLTPQQATDIASCRDCRQGSKMDYTVQVNFLHQFLDEFREKIENFLWQYYYYSFAKFIFPSFEIQFF